MLLLRLWGALGWPDETATEEIAIARYTVSYSLSSMLIVAPELLAELPSGLELPRGAHCQLVS